MSMFHRHFRVTSGALAEECARICAQNEASRQAFIPLLKEVGADKYHYWHNGEIAGFTFESPPDVNVWRHDRKRDVWLPRKNVPAGKKLWKTIEALPAPQTVQSALTVAGLTPNRPALIDGNRWYGPRLGGFSDKGIWFVDVPWREEDPEKMASYVAAKKAGTCFDADLDHLLWQPPAEWVEIKEWQYLKEWEEISGQSPKL